MTSATTIRFLRFDALNGGEEADVSAPWTLLDHLEEKNVARFKVDLIGSDLTIYNVSGPKNDELYKFGLCPDRAARQQEVCYYHEALNSVLRTGSEGFQCHDLFIYESATFVGKSSRSIEARASHS